MEYGEKVIFLCVFFNLFQKVKLSYILDELTCKVKHFKHFFVLIFED